MLSATNTDAREKAAVYQSYQWRPPNESLQLTGSEHSCLACARPFDPSRASPRRADRPQVNFGVRQTQTPLVFMLAREP